MLLFTMKSNYQNYVFGQKSYNGVAIISKKKLGKIEKDIFKDKNKQSRIITADLKHKSKTIKLINIYTPNGNPVDTEKYDYKKKWLDDLIKQLKALTKKNQNIIYLLALFFYFGIHINFCIKYVEHVNNS